MQQLPTLQLHNQPHLTGYPRACKLPAFGSSTAWAAADQCGPLPPESVIQLVQTPSAAPSERVAPNQMPNEYPGDQAAPGRRTNNRWSDHGALDRGS